SLALPVRGPSVACARPGRGDDDVGGELDVGAGGVERGRAAAEHGARARDAGEHRAGAAGLALGGDPLRARRAHAAPAGLRARRWPDPAVPGQRWAAPAGRAGMAAAWI